MYQPTPPPLSTIMENILPSVNTKHHFSKGLQSSSSLIQHCTALALSKCLLKYQQVRELFLKIADSLQEAESDVFQFLDVEEKEGQWRKRLRDMEKEVRRRVPDFQVVLAFSHHSEEGSNSGSKGEPGKGKEKEIAGEKATQKPNDTKRALLGEIAHRLLWLYQSCLPGMVAEARFDVGKLLGSFEAGWDATQKTVDDDDHEGRKPYHKLHDVERLHILRLLSASDQFSWSAKGSA
jgi:nucleolar pre-ribosomal-associated protein 1